MTDSHTTKRVKLTDVLDVSQVTQAYSTDICCVLNPKKPRCMPMPGFDETFVDIVDFILRITYWIWHEKKVDLCRDYYSTECAIHTMAGDIQGAEAVVKNTWQTLEAFPDRTLDGENVVWSVENEYDKSGEKVVYYSSHLIVSRMTNLGESEFGPPTGVRARIRTVADCVCTENKVVEEWLMRDNHLLVTTLGFKPEEVALKQAKKDLSEGGTNLLVFLEPERERVRQQAIDMSITVPPAKPTDDPAALARALFCTLWQKQEHDKIGSFYDFRVTAHLTAGRELYGTVELSEYLRDFQSGLTDIRIAVDHVACVPFLNIHTGAVDAAIRWTLVAEHSGDSKVLGGASGASVYILGSSHFRIIEGRVREEWTVFDELALLRQVATKRLLSPQESPNRARSVAGS
uniref:SnoaL-like domain-containing protein n=1 Tax=Chromera velia CCMP2878 TaxID=1169474 RepID=A0A0G4GCT2_9ALVE|eukprot:Cvel_21280.t1-p1 / transcript=Cvel_21280.t1 / gene=Cvel_21280 / organism=Chromera_velia_CCMP2878 / gene_product=hypothetical protein / transcript_product=hypothetical protein / location=Cvel_scaffold1981:13132-14337(-) / protein_length=402 / sequence_SO=supercontig / SO=protein_coding / is_pseudo=false